MEQNQFLNGIKILHAIDKHEIEAKLKRPMDGDSWQAFRSNPSRYFMRACDAEAGAIWAVIEDRNVPARGSL
jgi:hypothetical protein